MYIHCIHGNTMHCHSNLIVLGLDARNDVVAVVSFDGFSTRKMGISTLISHGNILVINSSNYQDM